MWIVSLRYLVYQNVTPQKKSAEVLFQLHSHNWIRMYLSICTEKRFFVRKFWEKIHTTILEVGQYLFAVINSESSGWQIAKKIRRGPFDAKYWYCDMPSLCG